VAMYVICVIFMVKLLLVHLGLMKIVAVICYFVHMYWQI